MFTRAFELATATALAARGLRAATIRTGLYPFHLWLLPRATHRLNLSERLLDHLVPVLAGLWLWGRALQLGGSELLFTPEILFVITLAIFAADVPAWLAPSLQRAWIWVRPHGLAPGCIDTEILRQPSAIPLAAMLPIS